MCGGPSIRSRALSLYRQLLRQGTRSWEALDPNNTAAVSVNFEPLVCEAGGQTYPEFPRCCQLGVDLSWSPPFPLNTQERLYIKEEAKACFKTNKGLPQGKAEEEVRPQKQPASCSVGANGSNLLNGARTAANRPWHLCMPPASGTPSIVRVWLT